MLNRSPRVSVMKRRVVRMSELEPVEIAISAEKVAFLIIKARAFDAKVQPVEPDPGSNPSDDQDRGVLEDYADDATEQELADAIVGLNEDEVIDLIAVAWVGRGDFGREEFDDARGLAAERHRADSSTYLMGIPMLGDYLDEGMAILGYEFDEDAMGHL
jgi:hypothetical protein